MSFHGTVPWMEETIGVDGASSSLGTGPVADEGEVGVRGEEGGFAAKGLRRNILIVDVLSFTDFSSRTRTCVSRSSRFDQFAPGMACKHLSGVRACRTSMDRSQMRYGNSLSGLRRVDRWKMRADRRR